MAEGDATDAGEQQLQTRRAAAREVDHAGRGVRQPEEEGEPAYADARAPGRAEAAVWGGTWGGSSPPTREAKRASLVSKEAAGRPEPRAVHWEKFGQPDIEAEYITSFPSTWWWDEARASRIGLDE